MELRSERTIIRPWRAQDEKRLDLWPPYNDPFETLWNLPRSWTSDFWSNGSENGFEREAWAVENTYGELIGRISLREIDRKRNQARLGITFGSPYVGHGYGTEALSRFLSYYFRVCGYSTMLLDVAAPNQRAVRSYLNLGFEYVSSDWRQASSLFDKRILEQPSYRALRCFFQLERLRVRVEFYEMRLDYLRWLNLERLATAR